MSQMGGKLGDIFWDLAPWVVYAAGYDLGCNIFVANTTGADHEYALMAYLSQNTKVLTEEPLTVYGYTWFKVEAGDCVILKGAMRFSVTSAMLTVCLVERETDEATDSVSTALVAPTTAVSLPPTPGAPAPTPGVPTDTTSWLTLMIMLLMLAMVARGTAPEKEEKKEAERKTLPSGRGK